MADQAHELQAMSEGVVVDFERLEFCGETFRLAESVGLMPLMRFAHAANSGLDSDDMRGLAAMYVLVRDTVHPEDWDRFELVAIDKRADGDQIMEFVGKAIEVIAARPTRPRSVSSAGPPPTSASLTEPSSSLRVPAGAEGLISVDELIRRAGTGM